MENATIELITLLKRHTFCTGVTFDGATWRVEFNTGCHVAFGNEAEALSLAAQFGRKK